MPLKLKLSIISGLAAGVAIALLAWMNLRIQSEHYTSDVERRGALAARMVKASLVGHMLNDRAVDFQGFLETLVTDDIEEIRIFATDGRILASSFRSEIGKHIYPLDMEMFQKAGKPKAFSHEKYGRRFVSMVLPIYNEKKCFGCHNPEIKVIGVLDVEVSAVEEMERRLSELKRNSIVALLVAGAALAAIVFMLAGKLVNRPLHEILRVLRRAQSGDAVARCDVGDSGEMGRLADEFNRLLDSQAAAASDTARQCDEKKRRAMRMATVGELSTSVIHQIKNPLAGMTGALQVLADGLPEGDMGGEIINEVNNQIRRIDRTLRELQTFARPPEPNFITVNINDVINQAVGMANRDVSFAPVNMIISASADLPDSEMDPDMMRQVLLYLATYCVTTGGRCETLTLSTRLDATGANTEIRLDGSECRMPPEGVDDIFEPVIAPRREATGLGLAISRDIIEKHHGIINAVSNAEGGIGFLISLPVRQPPDRI
ncbi:MAG: hypothetical protein HZA20_09755 [Nitrospirae bacterium]|nr:hypothetical protein [Nitrospirota bacterium]